MTGSDWTDNPSVVLWARHINDEMIPKLADSVCSISLVPGDAEDAGDVKFWVELGASIMLDKPIIAVVMGDRQIPDKLTAVADEIIRCPDGINPAASDHLRAAIERVVERQR